MDSGITRKNACILKKAYKAFFTKHKKNFFPILSLDRFSRIQEGEWNEVAGMQVKYFVVPHDATQTVGYAVKIDGRLFVIMTDVGRMTDEAVELSRMADTVVVESNYDIDMLMQGP